MAWNRGNPMFSNWWRLYSNPTKPEVAMEKSLAKLGKRYRVQHIILGAKAIADFLLVDDRIIIEVDGPSHYTKSGREKDELRTARLNLLGYSVVRCSNQAALEDADAALAMMLSPHATAQ